mmetsp:Transcript_71728/g.202507  ORF Transcript_71728/g.202507 Transcript_71728/m.202507 type:complete len:285 (+) Transcript_71728:4390-5244(+)
MAAWAARARDSVSLMAWSMTCRRSSPVSICRGAAAIATFSTSSSAASTFSIAAGIISSSCLEWTPSNSRSRASSSACFSSFCCRCALVTLLSFRACSASLIFVWSFRSRSPRAAISFFSASGAFCAASASTAMTRWVSASAVACAANSLCALRISASSASPSASALALSNASEASISASAAFSVAFCTRSSQSSARTSSCLSLSSWRRPSICACACALSIASFSAASMTTNSFLTSPSQGIVQPLFGGWRLQCRFRDHTCAPPTLLPNHHPLNEGPSRSSQKYR